MGLIKLIAPTTLIATLALFAPHAGAQTMGEYATTVAGVGSGGGSMGTSIGSAVNSAAGSDDLGGGSRTWGASSLGASFDERAGSASGSGSGADFDSRAGLSSGGSTSEARWPASQFQSGDSQSGGGSGTRFGDSSTRFQDQDRFTDRGELSSSDRFPAGVLDQNRQGLDSNYSSSSELDNSHSSN
jgi:hypothetical protein